MIPASLLLLSTADATLGQADIQLADTYKSVSSTFGEAHHRDLVDSERQWLHFVPENCPLGAIGGIPPLLARSCIRTAFTTRIQQLNSCAHKQPQERLSCLNAFRIFDKDHDAQ